MKLNKVINNIENAFLWLTIVMLFIMMLLTSVDAIGRYIFSISIPSRYEITEEYLMPYFVYMSIGYVFYKGGHVRITIFVDYLSKKINKVIMVIFNVITLLFFLTLIFVSLEKTYNAFLINEYSSSTLAYPLAPAYFSVSLGGMLLSLRLLQAICKAHHPE